jgi:hypothetical protein
VKRTSPGHFKRERKDLEIIKAPAKQPKTAPAQVRDGEAIEGVLGRHAEFSEFSDDPISPPWLRYTVATARFAS